MLPAVLLLRVVIVSASMLCVGCASTELVSGRLEAGPPTPYTAEQIREANPPGTWMVYQIEQAGQPPMLQTTEFIRANGDDRTRSVTIATVQSEDGQVLGEPRRSEATWEELRDHAAFDPDRTTRTPAVYDGATGRHDCWLYVVRGMEDGAPVVSRFYFARDRPGPPVYYEQETDGKVTFRMELIEDSRR